LATDEIIVTVIERLPSFASLSTVYRNILSFCILSFGVIV